MKKYLICFLLTVLAFSLCLTGGCAKNPDDITASEHTHEFGLVSEELPTCAKAGLKEYACDCGESYIEPISKLAHDFSGAGTSIVPATCLEDGSATYVCQRDNCSYSSAEVLKATGHSYIENVVEATCKSAGSVTVTCEHCDYADISVIEQLKHVVDSWNEVSKADCVTDGEKNGTCKLCKELVTEIEPKYGHDYSEQPFEATETTGGGITYTCQREECGHTYKEYTSDPTGSGNTGTEITPPSDFE